ncbi:MAG TPA: HAD-IA family hydrolase [Patescibacteria group bacterium]|nr:HAD-IA family hydrolase [Patescibacteria group bacterium]
MVKAIIFDCFGVIITDALAAICPELGVSQPEKLQQINDTLNASSHGFISREEGAERIAEVLGISVDDYRQRVARGEVKDQVLLNYIAGLRKIYKTAMLSNISKGGLPLRFTEYEMQKYFDIVVASGDIGFAKPEAQAYEYVADQLDVRLDECVFLDDRQDYCEGARGLGMQAIVYQNFARAKTELEELLNDSKR